ncbi:MAG: porphobilinogen synthase [Rickettsiales bacterium]|nr:porphobilinogen synthase [Rickettsiales bacterium]
MHNIRPRRLRANNQIRNLVAETQLGIKDFVMPIFIKEGNNIKTPIKSMPGIFQYSIDKLSEEIEEIISLGITTVLLFGIPKEKDYKGSSALGKNAIVQKAIKWIKANYPELIIISDLCLCDYTDHGHCGVLDSKTKIVDNDKTLEIFAKQAVEHAEAGSDIVAPSSMMDNVIGTLRTALDKNGFINTSIMSYSTKYASSFYGPFREALEVSLAFGDRKQYQMDYRNSDEALKETAIDIEQGADFIMVKPAHTYLDIIYKIKQNFPDTPLAAYHVSGEYAMLKAAAQNGWLDETATMQEVLTGIKRAGADIIISYFSKDIAKLIK